MRWDLEERTEDAIVAYLKTVVDGSIRVSAAWERKEPEFPAIVVHAGGTEPVSEDAEWDDNRVVAVSVAVMTEAVDELNASGKVIRTARERNADARSEAIDALATTDLLENVIAQGIPAIAFSQMQLAGSTRTVEDKKFVTTLIIEVIAEPVTGS